MPVSKIHLASIPVWLEKFYKDIAIDAERNFKEQKAYEHPNINRIEPFPEDVLESHRLGRLNNVGGRQLGRAESALEGVSSSFPEAHQAYMSPYMQHVLGEMGRQSERNFSERVLPGLEATFVRLGQHGSSRHKDLALRAARDMQAELMAKQREALESGYRHSGEMFKRDQERKFESSRAAQDLSRNQAGMHFANVEQLGRQGFQQQERGQQLRNLQYERAMKEQNFPHEQLGRYANIIQGVPAPANQYSYDYQPVPPGPGPLGQIGSIAGQLLGARMMQPNEQRKRGGYMQPPSVKRKGTFGNMHPSNIRGKMKFGSMHKSHNPLRKAK